MRRKGRKKRRRIFKIIVTTFVVVVTVVTFTSSLTKLIIFQGNYSSCHTRHLIEYALEIFK